MYTTFIHNKGKRYNLVGHKYMTIYMPKSYHVKTMLSSGSALPKMSTRSHNLLGYASLRSITIKASIPVKTEP